jgi:hypothetical protein
LKKLKNQLTNILTNHIHFCSYFNNTPSCYNDKMNEIEIKKSFGNKLVGTKRLQHFVITTLGLMPQNIIDYISSSTWFFGSLDDAWAFTFTGDDLKGKHLIFLSDDLLNQPASQIKFTIAHEIGHVILKHRNSVFEKQTKSEIRKQEKEADDFANKYL